MEFSAIYRIYNTTIHNSKHNRVDLKYLLYVYKISLLLCIESYFLSPLQCFEAKNFLTK